MPRTPFLVLVDPAAMRRAAIRQRLTAFATGAAVTSASAIAFALLQTR